MTYYMLRPAGSPAGGHRPMTELEIEETTQWSARWRPT